MFSYNVTFFILVSLCFISSFMVVFSKNPIFSVLFLILSFCIISSILLLLEVEYLPLIFLVIYVGAVAVLFLFVIMMLNLKIAEMKENSLQLIPIVLILCILFILQANILFQAQFTSHSYDLINVMLKNNLLCSYTNSVFFFQKFSNVSSISFLIFFEYSNLLLIASLVLLIGMVSSISLTLEKRILLRSQAISSQVLRDYNKQIILYS